MSAHAVSPLIYAAERVHTAACAITEPAGVPVEQIGDVKLAAAKRCRTCNPSSRRVAAIITAAQQRVEAVAAAQRRAAEATAASTQTVESIVEQSVRPARRLQRIAAEDVRRALDGTDDLYAGTRKCSDCGETKPITTFPTSTEKGIRVRLGYCRECRTGTRRRSGRVMTRVVIAVELEVDDDGLGGTAASDAADYVSFHLPRTDCRLTWEDVLDPSLVRVVSIRPQEHAL